MPLPIGLQVPTPPIHDQPALFKELWLVDVGGAHMVALLVAHLALDGILDQGTASPGAETMAHSSAGTKKPAQGPVSLGFRAYPG